MKPVRRAQQQGRFVIGVDFGTLSARALLVDVRDGREVASVVEEYPHGVISSSLPGSKKRLPADTALQHPGDYLAALGKIVPALLKSAKVHPGQVEGIGTDFTCCTILPVAADGTPLCLSRKWGSNPHAWVKLWKHHAAQPEANQINEIGAARGERFVKTYGGKYSSEWMFSKVLETVRQAPAVYAAAARFIEAGDWIVWMLCGRERRNLSSAGFKAMSVYPDGQGGWTYPSREFFRALDPRLENVVAEKLQGELLPLGSEAGGLTPEWADKLGLLPGTPVAVGNIDAHVAVPACGVTTSGKLVMIMGTSTCHLLIGDSFAEVEGISGVVDGGIVPGLWGYEAGQAGVGDLFAWFVERAVPAAVEREAAAAKKSVYALLEAKAAKLRPGESGLLALDWWNGNRSVLVDADLTGLLVGLSIYTEPHEIYRALLEATAFGTRKIIEAFAAKNIPITEVYACGGLAKKNPFMTQLYADITGRPIKIVASEQSCALGAAMHGAVAAGIYPDMGQAAAKMASPCERVCKPNPRSKPVYDLLYAEYTRLHDLFGRDPGGTMKVLKRLKKEVSL